MYLLIAVINDEELLDELITGWLDIGITGATVVETTDFLQLISHHIPIFAGLRKSIKTSDYNKMIFSVVQNDQALEHVISLIDEIVDFDVPGTGLLFVVPITLVRGMRLEELAW